MNQIQSNDVTGSDSRNCNRFFRRKQQRHLSEIRDQMDIDEKNDNSSKLILSLPNLQSIQQQKIVNEVSEAQTQYKETSNDCLVKRSLIFHRPDSVEHPMFAIPSRKILTKNKNNSNESMDIIDNEIDLESSTTCKQYNGFRNKENGIDFEGIHNKKLQFERSRDQQNLIDPNIPNMDKTEHIKWTKYDRKKDETQERIAEIRIIKTYKSIKGYHKNIEDIDKIHNITKTFIKEQKMNFCANILKLFFGVAPDSCGTTRTETQNLLLKKLAFPHSDTELIDFVLKELDKICSVLQSPFGITQLLYENILMDECLSYDNNQFFVTFQYVRSWKEFDEIINDIWNYMLLQLMAAKKIQIFDKFFVNLFNYCLTANNTLPNWNDIYTKITHFKTKYKKKNTYLFKAFFRICLSELKKTMIEQIRIKVIQAMFESIDNEKSIITKYQIYGFGGSGINDSYHFENNYHSKENLPAIDRLMIHDKTDPRIPERLREENRGRMKIMHPDLEGLTKTALFQLKDEVFMQLRCTSNPDFDGLIKKIMDRDDLKMEFMSLYKDFYFDGVNLYSLCKQTKEDRINAIYSRYIRGVLNKGIWSIIRTKEYTKVSMSLRQTEKIKHISKGNNKIPF